MSSESIELHDRSMKAAHHLIIGARPILYGERPTFGDEIPTTPVDPTSVALGTNNDQSSLLGDPSTAQLIGALPDSSRHVRYHKGPSVGALAETAMVCEWLKACRQTGEQPGFYYWQSNTVAEVDLIIEHGAELFGIEVKATATPTPHHADGLAMWLELGGRSARGVLACRIDEPTALRPGIRAVPWHLAW